MKINSNIYGISGCSGSGIVKRPENEVVKSHADAVVSKENTDKIIISDRGAKMAETEQLTKAVLSEMERPASSERIAALKEAVENKTYNVSANDLANALMQRWMGI